MALNFVLLKLRSETNVSNLEMKQQAGRSQEHSREQRRRPSALGLWLWFLYWYFLRLLNDEYSTVHDTVANTSNFERGMGIPEEHMLGWV